MDDPPAAARPKLSRLLLSLSATINSELEFKETDAVARPAVYKNLVGGSGSMNGLRAEPETQFCLVERSTPALALSSSEEQRLTPQKRGEAICATP